MLNDENETICRLRAILYPANGNWPLWLGQRMEMIASSAETMESSQAAHCLNCEDVAQQYLDDCFSSLCRAVRDERQARTAAGAEFIAREVKSGRLSQQDAKEVLAAIGALQDAGGVHPLDLFSGEDGRALMNCLSVRGVAIRQMQK